MRHGGLLALSMLVLHAANWLYHIVMSRALGPIEYGALSAVLGLLLLFTVPAHAIQMGMSAMVAREGMDAAGRGFPRGRWPTGTILFGVGAYAVLVGVSPWISSLFGLSSTTAIVVGASVLIPWSVLPYFRGWLQGHQRSAALGVSLTAEGVVKLAVAAFLVSQGLGVVGAISGVSLGAFAALLLTVPTRRFTQPDLPRRVHRSETLDVALAPYLLAVSAFSVLTQADVIVVKILFPAHEAGLYAAASTAGKIILYVTAPLAMVMLPEMVRRGPRSPEGRAVLLRGVRYAGALGGACVALYLAAPATLIRVLFGPGYADAAPLLGWLGLGMLAYELALLGMYYQLGAGGRGGLWSIIALAVIFPALALGVGKSVLAVAVLVAGLGAVSCTAVWWRVWPLLRGSSGGHGLGVVPHAEG